MGERYLPPVLPDFVLAHFCAFLKALLRIFRSIFAHFSFLLLRWFFFFFQNPGPTDLHSEPVGLPPLDKYLREQHPVDPPDDAAGQGGRAPGDGAVALGAARGTQVRVQEMTPALRKFAKGKKKESLNKSRKKAFLKIAKSRKSAKKLFLKSQKVAKVQEIL